MSCPSALQRSLVLCLVCLFPLAALSQTPAADWAAGLDHEAATLGKPAWRPMLAELAHLHRVDTHAPEPPFTFPWEDFGPGYTYGRSFGHWDLPNLAFDTAAGAPEHTREQLLNDIRLQLPSGFLPGIYWMRGNLPPVDPAAVTPNAGRYSPTQSHPPLWVAAADDLLEVLRSRDGSYDRPLMTEFLGALERQVAWFEQARKAQPDGFYYQDIATRQWESGVDDGVRFDGFTAGHPPAHDACIDATSHVYQMYVIGAKWQHLLGRDNRVFEARAAHLRQFIQTALWSERDGFFYDAWTLDAHPDGPRATWNKTATPGRPHAFEGLWPVMVGAATPAQAQRVIAEWLLNPARFYTPHPIATIALDDPLHSNRMWRGPAWNSMAHWAARGLIRYGYRTQAHELLERALDDSAAQFNRTGKLWEYYAPDGGKPEALIRKPYSTRNMPFDSYIGHDPLLAMALLWEKTSAAAPASGMHP